MYHVPVASALQSLQAKDLDGEGPTLHSDAIRPVLACHPLAQLRLIATSDLHASLMPYDYHANRPNANLGLGAISQQIAEARGEARNCLLFDNGECRHGPLADMLNRSHLEQLYHCRLREIRDDGHTWFLPV